MSTAKEVIKELYLAIQDFQNRLSVYERNVKNKSDPNKIVESKQKMLDSGKNVYLLCAPKLTEFEQLCLDKAADYMNELLKKNEK